MVISFSGFTAKPSYNYMRTLSDFKVDKLFILDDFGHKGSYYWFENGQECPKQLVQSLIGQIVIEGEYDRVITIGTSKGGTCAIYYGLMFGATDVYAGACQYYAGKYLSTEEHLPILKAMMGDCSIEEACNIVDRMLPDMIQRSAGSKTKIHLLYSKDEHTYDEHIQFLLSDLQLYYMQYTEAVESFKNHNDVGQYFVQYLKKELTK